MVTRPTAANRFQHFMPHFEVASVLLLATLLIGAAPAAQAQGNATSPSADIGAASQMTVSGPVGAAGPESVTLQNKTGTSQLDAAFERADADGDGKLSREEIEHFPALAQRFEQFDTDHDGFLSRAEFNKAAGY